MFIKTPEMCDNSVEVYYDGQCVNHCEFTDIKLLDLPDQIMYGKYGVIINSIVTDTGNLLVAVSIDNNSAIIDLEIHDVPNKGIVIYPLFVQKYPQLIDLYKDLCIPVPEDDDPLVSYWGLQMYNRNSKDALVKKLPPPVVCEYGVRLDIVFSSIIGVYKAGTKHRYVNFILRQFGRKFNKRYHDIIISCAE